MSSFRPKVKAIDSRNIVKVYDERAILRMIRNGATKEHARTVIIEKYQERIGKRKARGIAS